MGCNNTEQHCPECTTSDTNLYNCKLLFINRYCVLKKLYSIAEQNYCDTICFWRFLHPHFHPSQLEPASFKEITTVVFSLPRQQVLFFWPQRTVGMCFDTSHKYPVYKCRNPRRDKCQLGGGWKEMTDYIERNRPKMKHKPRLAWQRHHIRPDNVRFIVY